MKIYFASQSFYPYIGGVSTYLINLEKEMVKKGNEVVEVHLRLSGEDYEDTIKGIEIHRVPRDPINQNIMLGYSKFKEKVYRECHYNAKTFTKPYNQMDGYEEFNKVNEYFGKELEDLLKHTPADIVHIHDFQLLFTYKHVPRGTPLIITWHIPFISNMSKQLSEFLIKHLKEYDKVVFSSQKYINAAIKAGLPKEKTELIYPVTDTNFFKIVDVDKNSVKKKYNIAKNSKIILCVQRIDAKSGHEQLIKSLLKIKKQVPNAKLVFAGGDSMSNKLSKDRSFLIKKINQLIKNYKLEKDVIFTGSVNNDELRDLYNTSDLVCLCSKNEGFGLSITEAMSCGNPIVGTNVGGIPIQVKDGINGYLVDVDDIDSMSEKIIKIINNKKLRKAMSEKSVKIVEAKFKTKYCMEKHLMLYNKLKKQKNEFHGIEHLDVSKISGIITDYDMTITDKASKPYFDPKDIDVKLLGDLSKINENLILATGRNISYVKKICKLFKKFRCVIAENGAVIYFPKTKKTITINSYYMARAKKIIKNLDLPNTTFGKVITSNKTKDEKIIKEKLGKIFEKIKFIKNDDEIMALPMGVDKGIGLKIAMNYLNIDMDNTIIVGNGLNDVDMFMNPGFKIALSNACEKLKKLSNHITKNPSKKGIKEIINHLTINDKYSITHK